MKKHTKVLFDYFGYDESSLILCEVCGKVATDCHHIDSRWKFGSKNKEDMDRPNNLIFLCRKCHMDAHGPASRDVKQQLKEIVNRRGNGKCDPMLQQGRAAKVVGSNPSHTSWKE